ncbi:MAG: hypothetical protein M3155_08315 [Actinomycetota bacterium]|nr:hypothetical protein [Actinomycetota bacterium]
MVTLASSADTVMSAFLVAVMICGFVVLWALWHFVFRKAPPDDRRHEDSSSRARE